MSFWGCLEDKGLQETEKMEDVRGIPREDGYKWRSGLTWQKAERHGRGLEPSGKCGQWEIAGGWTAMRELE